MEQTRNLTDDDLYYEGYGLSSAIIIIIKIIIIIIINALFNESTHLTISIFHEALKYNMHIDFYVQDK